MLAVFWIAVGGAIGSVSRYGLSMLVDRHVPSAFPWGTMVCNVLGCFIIGWLAQWLVVDRPDWIPVPMRQGVMVGVLGGFTTFSTFSLQTLALIRDEGDWSAAMVNIGLSLVLCLLAVWAGASAAGSLSSD